VNIFTFNADEDIFVVSMIIKSMCTVTSFTVSSPEWRILLSQVFVPAKQKLLKIGREKKPLYRMKCDQTGDSRTRYRWQQYPTELCSRGEVT
jgi:hypothetical protein